MKNTITLSILLILTMGCQDEVSKSKPGYFRLTEVKQSSNDGGRTKATTIVNESYDLGDIKASKEYFFLLSNLGDNPITNIKLSIDNEMFIISPTKISSLAGFSVGGNSVMPLISIGVIHGFQLNGVGYTDLLPMGENKVTLRIEGQTVDNGTIINIESNFELIITARQLDVTLFSGTTEIDYSEPFGQCVGCEYESGLPYINTYVYNPADFKIKNTGNVDISITLHPLGDYEGTSFTLAPNEQEMFAFSAPSSGQARSYYISLDGNGTTSDQSRIKMGTNGKGYLIVYE